MENPLQTPTNGAKISKVYSSYATSIGLSVVYIRKQRNEHDQQIIVIPMSTKCAPLLADIFLYFYEAKFNSVPALGRQEAVSISV